MSVAEIGQLHNRYVRLSDKFKTLWTFHQFVSGVYKNLLEMPLPYQIDFQDAFEPVKRISDLIQSADPTRAVELMERTEKSLGAMIRQLIEADEHVPASVMRRFFEKLRQQDEKIIFFLIKFYLFADSVEGDRRDKLDFLFTKIAEEFIEERGEYASKDSLELRKKFQSLLSIRPAQLPEQDDAVALIRKIRDLRDEIVQLDTFEKLVDDGLLERARKLKHEIGDAFFHPDVLLAIVQLNVTTKNRFASLYGEEEQRIMLDSSRLLENESAIEQGLGEGNPDLRDEMQRFKEFKKEFDDSRATSNVKANVIARLKSSMTTILSQLDEELGESSEVDAAIPETVRSDLVTSRFGEDPQIHEYLMKMTNVIESLPRGSSLSEIQEASPVAALRLEPWEISAYRALFHGDEAIDDELQDLYLLYLRAAALRLRIDDEARKLATYKDGMIPESGFLERVKESLDRAKEMDVLFKHALQEGMAYSNPTKLHRLYRSRLRLLRVFSGLWLVYDQQTSRVI